MVITNLAANEKEISANPSYGDGVSTTLHYYQKTVESLLDRDSCPGVSVEELELFKNQFRTSAYTCRLRSCPRATIGFDSDQLCREHEMIHAGGFRCQFLGCQYPPFRSSKTLATHVTANHSQFITQPRRSIRRVGHLTCGDSLESSGTPKEGLNKESNCGKGPSSAEDQSSLLVIARTDSTRPSRKRPRSPPSSLHESFKIKGLGPPCRECAAKKLQCNKTRPICGTCKRRSRVCTYPNSCERCLLRGFTCASIGEKCKSNEGENTALLSKGQRRHNKSDSEKECFMEDADGKISDLKCRLCNEESSGFGILCDNFRCPWGWFHLNCVDLGVTPNQSKKWFCSKVCQKKASA